ncbi:MAG TPA: hypothetical protein VIX18_10290 [Nitrospirota bacterium]
MWEQKKIRKTEADKTVKVKIEVSGFPSVWAGSKFFEQSVKEEYKRLFEGSNLRVDRNDVIAFEMNICCKTTNRETEWYVGSETMHHCLYLGKNCPVL